MEKMLVTIILPFLTMFYTLSNTEIVILANPYIQVVIETPE